MTAQVRIDDTQWELTPTDAAHFDAWWATVPDAQRRSAKAIVLEGEFLLHGPWNLSRMRNAPRLDGHRATVYCQFDGGVAADTLGSSGIHFHHLRLVTDGGRPDVGLLCARLATPQPDGSDGRQSAGAHTLDGCVIAGTWQKAAWYTIDSEANEVLPGCRFENTFPQAPAVYWAKADATPDGGPPRNPLGVQSTFGAMAPVATAQTATAFSLRAEADGPALVIDGHRTCLLVGPILSSPRAHIQLRADRANLERITLLAVRGWRHAAVGLDLVGASDALAHPRTMLRLQWHALMTDADVAVQVGPLRLRRCDFDWADSGGVVLHPAARLDPDCRWRNLVGDFVPAADRRP